MAHYLILRLLDAIPTVLLVLTPGVRRHAHPAGRSGDRRAGRHGDAPSSSQIFREQMGLNVPIWQQYINFLGAS